MSIDLYIHMCNLLTLCGYCWIFTVDTASSWLLLELVLHLKQIFDLKLKDCFLVCYLEDFAC